MKKYKIYTFLLATSFLLIAGTGCKKFLERPPEGQMTEDEAFKDEQALLNFTNGIYTITGDNEFFGGRRAILNELLGDHYKGDKFTGDFAEIYGRKNSFFGGTRDGFYKKAYQVITRANVALSHLDIASTQRNYVEGQAKFFRGLAHFELVRLMAQPWGYSADNSHLGIPLRLSVTLTSLERSTVKVVYDQIIADLKSAVQLLPALPANGKFFTATKLSAEAYLAKVYFQMNNFDSAYKYADLVIASNKFQLDNNYEKRFSIGLSTEGIWVIPTQNDTYDEGKELKDNFSSTTKVPTFVPTDIFYSHANARATDGRRIWYSNTLHPGNNVITKFNKPYFDMPVLHLTEIKLIRIEAGAEKGGATLTTAINDMNQLLERAYGNTTFNLPPTSSQALVIATARSERELELVGEGNRAQEIKRIGARSGANIDRRGSLWNCNGFILQFPKAEQDANLSFKMNPEGGCF